jgi:hypothetical protein
VLLVVGLATLVLVRHLAARRLGTGRVRYAWLSVAPTFVFPAAILWVAVTQAPRQPVLGIIGGVIGLGYGYLAIRMARAVALATRSTETPDEFFKASEEPFADFLLITTTLGLIGAIVLGVALIVAAVVGGGL